MPYKRIRRTGGLRQRKRARYLNRRRPLMMKRKARSSRALTKKIKSVIMRTVESKVKGSVFNTDTNQAPEVLGVVQLANIANVPFVAGTTTWNYKSGQEYYITGFKLGFSASNAIVAAGDPITPVYLRVMILEASNKQAGIAPTSTMSMFRGVDFVNQSYANIDKTIQALWYPVDSKWYKTVFNKVIKIGNNGSFDTQNRLWYIPYLQKIKTMGTASGEDQQNKTYYLVWFGYEPKYGTAGGGAWNVDYQHQTFFRDP